jgi:aspartate dehydrogenase
MLNDVNIEIVAVAKRDWSAPGPELPTSARPITHPEELEAVQPDVVAEAASRESVGPWGRAALETGADFIVSSVSAFSDNALLESLRTIAEQNDVQILIQPGALGGVDALSAARKMGIDTVEHRIVKPPRAWLGTPAEDLCALDALAAPEVFFDGTAAEAASQFPKNANVAMTTALAGIGPERTKIRLVADPAATTNRHEIVAQGAFGQLAVSISNNPLPDNPKTSAMAALNLVRSIENQVAAIVL